MKKELKTIDDFNREKLARYGEKPIIYNGIQCPECGHELLDRDLNMVLASFPPRTATICSNKDCSYQGTRYC